MFNNYDDILNISELAEALKIGFSQAYKLVKTGKIKAYKEGRDWKVTKVALIEYFFIYLTKPCKFSLDCITERLSLYNKWLDCN